MLENLGIGDVCRVGDIQIGMMWYDCATIRGHIGSARTQSLICWSRYQCSLIHLRSQRTVNYREHRFSFMAYMYIVLIYGTLGNVFIVVCCTSSQVPGSWLFPWLVFHNVEVRMRTETYAYIFLVWYFENCLGTFFWERNALRSFLCDLGVREGFQEGQVPKKRYLCSHWAKNRYKTK